MHVTLPTTPEELLALPIWKRLVVAYIEETDDGPLRHMQINPDGPLALPARRDTVLAARDTAGTWWDLIQTAHGLMRVCRKE